MESIAIVRNALDLARKHQVAAPDFGSFTSCILQLEYLSSLLNKEIQVDLPKLRSVIIGHYGAREFEESAPELTIVLMNAQVMALRLAKGLKIP